MRRNHGLAVVLMTGLLLAGCGGRREIVATPGADRYFTDSANAPEFKDYRISPLDVLSIKVFQVEELSLDTQVDAAGQLTYPLIGKVKAAGLTTVELADEIGAKLSERYLQSPQVLVVVKQAVSQKVTVEGSVTQPGVFEMEGSTSLLQAIAMARGPTRVASLRDVVIFRTIEGQRMAAVFDLKEVRRGAQADPELRGGDVVVVGISNMNQAWQDVIQAIPAAAVFVNVLR